MASKCVQYVREAVARLIAWLIFRGPVTVTLGTARLVFVPKDGRLLPAMAGGAEDDDEEEDDKDDDEASEDDDASKGKGDDKTDDDDSEDDVKGKGKTGDENIDWKKMARRHERHAKAQKKRADELAEAQRKRDEANQSEQEKALAKAREEGKTEALTTAQKERRSDRLEVAVTRLAARGIKVGEGEKAKTVKFADPEDALVFIERAIAKGDLDEDDVFDDDHKVKLDEITTELADLLERKPRLAADADEEKKGSGRDVGDADAGKGKGGGGKDLEELSPDEHFKQIRRTK